MWSSEQSIAGYYGWLVLNVILHTTSLFLDAFLNNFTSVGYCSFWNSFFIFLLQNNFHYRQPHYWSWSVIFCGGLCLWNNIHGLWKVGLKRNLHFAGIQRRPTFGWTQHCCLHSSSGCNIFILYWNFKEDSKDSSPMSLAHSFIHTESQFKNNTMFILTFSVTFLGPRGPHLIS